MSDATMAPDVPKEDMEMEMKEGGMMAMSMNEANLVFLAVAFEMALMGGLELFRYKSIFALPMWYLEGVYF